MSVTKNTLDRMRDEWESPLRAHIRLLESALKDTVFAFDEMHRAYQGKPVRNLDERVAAVDAARKHIGD